jgi:hypothetical protein
VKISALFVACFVLCIGATAAAGTDPASGFDAGVQLSHITYREPGVMRQSGFMYGVVAAYTAKTTAARFKVDGTLTHGYVKYVGALMDGTPITINNIPDTMFEIRATVGPVDSEGRSGALLPYLGLGYRYLYDGSNVASGGYRRESNYLYLPIGIDGGLFSNRYWRGEFNVEYDAFLRGWQVSHLSDTNSAYNDVTNRQHAGYGYRASVRFIRSGEREIIFEPFYKYWKIAESEPALWTHYGIPIAYLVEPNNNSTEVGLKVQMRF